MTAEGSGVERQIRVFVHLARGYGAADWKKRWAEGKIIGIHDPLPYGYYRAQELGC